MEMFQADCNDDRTTLQITNFLKITELYTYNLYDLH